jgi:hypothetical protein
MLIARFKASGDLEVPIDPGGVLLTRIARFKASGDLEVPIDPSGVLHSRATHAIEQVEPPPELYRHDDSTTINELYSWMNRRMESAPELYKAMRSCAQTTTSVHDLHAPLLDLERTGVVRAVAVTRDDLARMWQSFAGTIYRREHEPQSPRPDPESDPTANNDA